MSETPAVDTGRDDIAERMQARCLGTRVSQLQRLLARRYDAALRPLGMTVQQMEILTALTLLDPEHVRPSQLAIWLSTERSTMSRNLAALTSRGWLQTAARTPTGRAQTVELTAAGRRAYAQAQPLWEQAQAATEADLGASSIGTIDRWLDRLTP